MKKFNHAIINGEKKMKIVNMKEGKHIEELYDEALAKWEEVDLKLLNLYDLLNKECAFCKDVDERIGDSKSCKTCKIDHSLCNPYRNFFRRLFTKKPLFEKIHDKVNSLSLLIDKMKEELNKRGYQR